MSKLAGKKAFVAGGAGGVGAGIVRVLLDEGATVMVSSRSQESLQALQASVASPDRLIPVQDDVGDSSRSDAIRSRIQSELGALDIAVASIGGGGWKLGIPLLDLAESDWQRVMNDGLTGHFVAAKTLIPTLVQGGTYILINGGAALAPIPKLGPMCVVALGQVMIKDVLAAEIPASPARISTLMLNSIIVTERNRHAARPEWVTAEDVGRAAVHLVMGGESFHGKMLTLDSREQTAALLAGA